MLEVIKAQVREESVQLPSEMHVKLEHRAKCKTQPLLEYQAKQRMMRHVADGHGGGGVAADRVVN